MLNVTDAATSYLSELLSASEAPEGVAVRFVYESQGFQMQTGSEQPGDTTFDHEGRTILLMEEQVADLLAERTMDVHDAGGRLFAVIPAPWPRSPQTHNRLAAFPATHDWRDRLPVRASAPRRPAHGCAE